MAAQWNPERLAKFSEGVQLCLGSWTALQLAVDNQWGGRNSAEKAQQLGAEVVNFMTQSRGTPYIDDLEDLLDEKLLVAFNTEIDDGSIEEVAEIVMYLHQECAAGNFDRVQQLAAAASGGAKKSVCHDQEEQSEDVGDGDQAEASQDILVEDTPDKNPAGASSEDSSAQSRKLTEEEIADGWQMVSHKGRGRRKH